MKIGARGQLTIPKRIREEYKFLPKPEVEFVPEKTVVLIVKKNYDKSPMEKAFGILRKNESTDRYLQAVRGNQK